jgi:hypothetical protein
LEWLKKNKKYVILVALILFAVVWISIREAVIKKQQRKIDQLEFANFALNRERMELSAKFKALQADYEKLFAKNDSMKLALSAKQKELRELQEKHKKQIDSLLNVPPDTIYKRLGLIFPNFDASPLEYPFSGSQIKPMYAIAISYPLLSQEYTLQGKTLNTCLDLNKGYEKSEANLKAQITNLQTNIGLCDQQVTNYQSEVKILNRRVKNRGFWSKTMFATTIIATGIAILK